MGHAEIGARACHWGSNAPTWRGRWAMQLDSHRVGAEWKMHEEYLLPGALASEHLEGLIGSGWTVHSGCLDWHQRALCSTEGQLLLVPSTGISTDWVASQLGYLLPSCQWVIPAPQVFSACFLTLKIIEMFSSVVSAISQMCVLSELSGRVNEGEIKFTFSAVVTKIL